MSALTWMRNGARRRFDDLAVSSAAGVMTRAIAGARGWRLLDRMGVPGFGTYLLRSHFPLADPAIQSWATNDATYRRIEAIFDAGRTQYEEIMAGLSRWSDEIAAWPRAADAMRPDHPVIDNEFFPLADAIVLYGLLRQLKPRRFFEIGSGTSTRIANRARVDGALQIEIVSVDPEPRAAIDALCDRRIRRSFEGAAIDIANELEAGDILFMDGSHHCFPNSDVTHLFFNVLPALRSGVIVHLHDIHLPADYPLELRSRLWSEQYVLGAWLLGGAAGYRVMFPGAYMSERPALRALVDRHAAGLANLEWHRQGTSFWMVRE